MHFLHSSFLLSSALFISTEPHSTSPLKVQNSKMPEMVPGEYSTADDAEGRASTPRAQETAEDYHYTSQLSSEALYHLTWNAEHPEILSIVSQRSQKCPIPLLNIEDTETQI